MQKLAEITGEDCTGLFQAELNTIGNDDAPATHCVCNWNMTNDQYEATKKEFDKPKWNARQAEADSKLIRNTTKKKYADFLSENGFKKRRRRPQD